MWVFIQPRKNKAEMSEIRPLLSIENLSLKFVYAQGPARPSGIL